MSEQSAPRPAVALRADGDAPTAQDLSALDAPGPEFCALVANLRTLVRQQENVAKAENARRNTTAVMAKASEMFAEGRITAHELNTLHAVRLRLDASLPEWDRS